MTELKLPLLLDTASSENTNYCSYYHTWHFCVGIHNSQKKLLVIYRDISMPLWALKSLTLCDEYIILESNGRSIIALKNKALFMYKCPVIISPRL